MVQLIKLGEIKLGCWYLVVELFRLFSIWNSPVGKSRFKRTQKYRTRNQSLLAWKRNHRHSCPCV